MLAIILHDTKGCILLGMSQGTWWNEKKKREEPVVWSSREAVSRLEKQYGFEPFTLVIKGTEFEKLPLGQASSNPLEGSERKEAMDVVGGAWKQSRAKGFCGVWETLKVAGLEERE